MNWGEAQQAFQQGTVDGQENPVVSVIIPFKLWTSQKHLTAWHYAIDPVIIAVSKLTWDGLTPADREIVRKTAVEMAAWEKAGARKGLADSAAAYDELRKNGMEGGTLTPADPAAVRQETSGGGPTKGGPRRPAPPAKSRPSRSPPRPRGWAGSRPPSRRGPASSS